jgi:uncharacterized protein YggU (UPF0235/DUF167 family)
MKIIVKVKTKAKEDKVIPPERTLWKDVDENQNVYKVWVTEAPVKGKANKAVVRLLAEYFKIGESFVVLTKGSISKTKVFDILY